MQASKKKISKRRATIILLLVIIGLTLLLTLVYMLRHHNSQCILLSSEGTVERLNNGIWEKINEGDAILLYDTIRADGEATLSCDKMLIALDSGTEINIESLDEDIAIKQIKGSTWNKVFGLIKGEKATVEYQKVNAMVIGTEFGVADDGITVAEGVVRGSVSGNEYLVTGLMRLSPDGSIVPADKELLLRKMVRSLIAMKKYRREIIRKHPIQTKIVLKLIGEQSVDEALKRADKENYDFDELMRRSPVSTKTLEKIMFLTKKIKKQQELIKELEEK